MLGQSISKNSIMLGLFAIISTGVIAGLQLSTRGLIAENIRHAEERALLEIIPQSRHDNSMLDDIVAIDNSELLGLRGSKTAYRARLDGKIIAVIIPATARDGYTGDIDMIVGINIDGSIAGTRVLSHRETPGLGDQVDYKKSQWVDGFMGKSLRNPTPEKWTVKKDHGVFDQFTGATITPRAVTKAIKQTLEYYQGNTQILLATAGEENSE
ncbi:MAG: electron transport complex subunit RsxG [Spongiibacteraceae bacterium]